MFGRAVDLLVHRLGGLDLARAERVSVVIRDEHTGHVFVEEPAVPFEPGSNEVLIACRRHFAAFPPDIVIEVRASGPAGAAEQFAAYTIQHSFEQPSG